MDWGVGVLQQLSQLSPRAKIALAAATILILFLVGIRLGYRAGPSLGGH